MDKFSHTVKKMSAFVNEAASWGVVLSMLLVVLNVILRAFFKRPILGTYEYVCFLSAVIVGCGIAYCAAIDGHIAIGFVLEKLGKRAQGVTGIIISVATLIGMLVFTWRMFLYAARLAANNEVSPTTQTPFYLFVYITAIGFLVLCLVLLDKAIRAFKEVRRT
ncbi:MAG: TRAP transporter small permease [Clostridiaceae bacterium]|nr:TRAP transporter small permease [Clostridiaceae bacterium]